MSETFEQHFAQTPEEKPKSLEEIKEEKVLALKEEIRGIKEKIERGELTGGKAIEGYQRITALVNKIKKLDGRVGWQLEGRLTEENVLLEYQAGGFVYAANFSPKGDKVVIGSSGDGMVSVISLTEKDEKGNIIPRVLAEYQVGRNVCAANFSPEGDKVVIGSKGEMQVISLAKKDEKGNIIPRVLAEYQAGGWVWAANFSPEGDKVVIGSEDGEMKVLGAP